MRVTSWQESRVGGGGGGGGGRVVLHATNIETGTSEHYSDQARKDLESRLL